MRRCFVAAAVLIAGGLAGPLTARAQSASELLLPDLTTVPRFLMRTKIRRTKGGRRLLRFPVPITNLGRGPLEMRGSRSSTREEMHGRQIVYTSDGGSQSFDLGTWEYHKAHHHWHVASVADYNLLDSTGAVVGSTPKVSFFLEDNTPINKSLPGAPRVRKYIFHNRFRNPKLLSLRTGISVGWADNYDESVPGQYIDITGLPHGVYTIQVKVNPEGILMESNPNNNVVQVPVRI